MEQVDYTLPNGQVIKIPADASEEKKAELTAQFTNDEPEINNDEAGMVGNWRPEGAKTSWLFDNAVVAPYEGARKFLNSTSSLVEGLGDTLGETTNLGGFRYGKDAENGAMEYVSYEEALKAGNVKGILAPITGNIGKKDYARTKGFFYDPDKINPEDNTESLSASFVEGGVQFILGWVTGGKILKGAKIGTQVTRKGQFTKATAQGALADFIGFDELSGRLTDMVVEHSPQMADTWLGYLQSDPNDKWWEARMKNTLEGAGIGAFADLMMLGLRASKGYIAGNIDERLIKHDEKIIGQAQEKIQGAKELLDNAKTTSEKMEILSRIVEPLVKKPKLKISDSKKRTFLNKLASEDLDINFKRYKNGEITADEAFSIPHQFININTMDSKIVTKGFINVIKGLHDAVYKNARQVDVSFTDEAIKRKSILQYGGDLNKVYADFNDLAKNTTDRSALIYSHEIMLSSLVEALPAFRRQAILKQGGRTNKDVDDTLAYILAMQKNKQHFGTMTGGNLRTLGVRKQELINNKGTSDALESAIREFEEFSTGVDSIKAKNRLLDKIATLNQPSVTRQIMDFVTTNRSWEVLNEVWINALLSNPKTQLINAIGNGITAMVKPIEAKLGANISALISRNDIGRVTKYNALSKEAGHVFAGLFQSLGDAIKVGGKAFKQGELILEGSSGASKIDTGTNTIKGLKGDLIRLPSRALNAGDEVFKQINYRAKLRSIVTRDALELGLKGKEFTNYIEQGFKDGFDDVGRGMNDEAIKYAREATYTNELTGFTKQFQNAVNEYPFLKQIFPFIRTPFQLAKSIVDRSPLALGYRRKHIFGMSNDPVAIAKARGEVATGMILFSSAFALAKFGMLNSDTNRTDDKWSETFGLEKTKSDGKVLNKFTDSEMMRFKKTEKNFKPYSFVINGKSFPFGRLDPYGAFFGIVADIATNYEKLKQEEIEKIGADMQLFMLGQMEESPISTGQKIGMGMNATFTASVDNILSKTYLQSVHEIVNALFTSDEKAWQRAWNNKWSSYIPNVVTKIVNDPYLRDATTFMEKIKQRTGMGVVEPKFNFMGKPHKNPEGGVERIFNNMLSPVTVSKDKESIIADEILRLGKAPANMKKYQENVDFSQYVNKQGVSAFYRLNFHLNTVKRGEPKLTLEQALKKVITSPDYKNLTDPLKIGKGIADDGTKYNEIERIYNLFKIDAKNALRKEWSVFKHKDDDRRTLSGDISKTNKNKIAISQTNRTDKSLIESLVALENFN